jgi:Ca2+-binding EF-hand superfamily protein
MKKSILCVLLSSAVALFSMGAQANHHEGKAHGDMFKEADTNADGKVSLEEFKVQHEKRMNEMFKKLDTNSDGFIDEAEKKAGHDKMRAMRKEHGKNHHEKMDNTPPPAK